MGHDTGLRKTSILSHVIIPLVCCLFCSILLPSIVQLLIRGFRLTDVPPSTNQQYLTRNLTLVGTNDLHGSVEGLGLSSYPDKMTGGYARLLTLMDDVRSSQPGDLILTFDAGDWFSGSLFDYLAVSQQTKSVPHLEFFHIARYDVVILGNHEFDRTEDSLYRMLEKADDLELDINIVLSNLSPLPKKSKFMRFKHPQSHVKLLPYYVKENAATRVCVLGYMAPDSLLVSNRMRVDLQFTGFSGSEKEMGELVRLATRQVSEVREDCHYVVVVVHGGKKDGEDEIFHSIPGIDIILGGHSHERYLTASRDRGTMSSQCGAMGQHLTVLRVGRDHDHGGVHYRGPPKMSHPHGANLHGAHPISVNAGDKSHPQCIPVDNSIPKHAKLEGNIKRWKQELKDVLSIEPDKIIYKDGDLSHLFNNSLRSSEENATIFAHRLLEQFHNWETQGPGSAPRHGHNTTSSHRPVYTLFWHPEFLATDILHSADPESMTLTYSDLHYLLHLSGITVLRSLYIDKSALYILVQSMFLVNKLISPSASLCTGGVLYDETVIWPGVPIIHNIRTVSGIPYREWPARIRVLVNDVQAPFLWWPEKLTLGLMGNFPKDEQGNSISIDDVAVRLPIVELDLALQYFAELNRQRE